MQHDQDRAMQRSRLPLIDAMVPSLSEVGISQTLTLPSQSALYISLLHMQHSIACISSQSSVYAVAAICIAHECCL